eukprot:g1723.t1
MDKVSRNDADSGATTIATNRKAGTPTMMSRAEFVASMIALLEEKEKSASGKAESETEAAAANAFEALLYDFPDLSARDADSLSESLVNSIARSRTAALPGYFQFRSKYFESLAYLAKTRRDSATADADSATQDKYFSALMFINFVLLPLEILRGRFGGDLSALDVSVLSSLLAGCEGLTYNSIAALSPSGWREDVFDSLLALMHRFKQDIVPHDAEICLLQQRTLRTLIEIVCDGIACDPARRRALLARVLKTLSKTDDEEDEDDVVVSMQLVAIRRITESKVYGTSRSLRDIVHDNLQWVDGVFSRTFARSSFPGRVPILRSCVAIFSACARTRQGSSRMFKSGIVRTLTRVAKSKDDVRHSVSKALLACALQISECREFLTKVPNFARAVGLRSTESSSGEPAASEASSSVEGDDLLLWAITLSVTDSSYAPLARRAIVRDVALPSSTDTGGAIATKEFIDSLSAIARSLTALDSARPILSLWEHWSWLKNHLNQVDERLRVWGAKVGMKRTGETTGAQKEEEGEDKTAAGRKEGHEASEFVEEKAIEMTKKVRLLIRKIVHIGSKSD